MKILIVFTGGTIGSALKDNLISPDIEQCKALVSDIDDVEFDYITPYYILSEQLSGSNLTALVKAVGENLSKGYDGIVVTHGTDTLQYSASALSVAFGKSNIPIVLVSSNYILQNPKANGRDNFRYAIKFIREKIGGVYVSYKNNNGRSEIYHPKMIMEHEIYRDDVHSIDGAFGYFKDNKFVLNHSNIDSDNMGVIRYGDISPVLWLKVYPSMRAIDTKDYKAILLQGYHSGTLPTKSKDFISTCKGAKVPIYFLGAVDGDKYESTKKFKELGIEVLPKISPIYAYIKLWAEIENSGKI